MVSPLIEERYPLRYSELDDSGLAEGGFASVTLMMILFSGCWEKQRGLVMVKKIAMRRVTRGSRIRLAGILFMGALKVITSALKDCSCSKTVVSIKSAG
jgi:hypothetical protein